MGSRVGSDGNLWFTEHGKNKIGRITTSGSITTYELPTLSEPLNIVAGPGGLWFAMHNSDKIGKISYPEGEVQTPAPGYTLRVPSSPIGLGTALDDQWRSGQVGTDDDPVEATAILPPDSPQAWPASSYKRATVYYMKSPAPSLFQRPPRVPSGTVPPPVQVKKPPAPATTESEAAKPADASKGFGSFQPVKTESAPATVKRARDRSGWKEVPASPMAARRVAEAIRTEDTRRVKGLQAPDAAVGTRRTRRKN